MTRGHLRIYLGAAPGVGKTYAMLDEGNRRRARGTDVVIGFVETHGRARTAAQIGDLPVVPRRRLATNQPTAQAASRPTSQPASASTSDQAVSSVNGTEEMDVDAILARRPAVVLVDELAHANAPGSRHDKRWRDVDELLDAGIDVVSTLNIEHLESVNDLVDRITGVKQPDTVPDAVVRAADQVELIDMSPEALRRRLAHGNIYAAEQVDSEVSNYFRAGNLGALRELALLWVADKVDESLQRYLTVHDIPAAWETRERVVVAVTGAPSGEHLIRRAARMAQRAKAELVGVHVSPAAGAVAPSGSLLDRHRQLLADLGGVYHEVVGADIAEALVQFGRAEHATQLVLGATHRSRWRELTQGSVINRVIREAAQIDVHVISETPVAKAPMALATPRRRSPLARPRRLAGWALTLLGIPLLTLTLLRLHDDVNLTSVALMYLFLVTVVAVVGGSRPSIVAAVSAPLVFNWFFTEPVHTFTIAERDHLLAFLVFFAVAGLVSMVVSQASQRSADVLRARAEAEALARIAGGVYGEDDPLADMVSHLRSTFGLEGVAVLMPASSGSSGWSIVEAAGSSIPLDPATDESVPLAEGAVLTMRGPALSAEDRRVLQVFAAQLSAALERRNLRGAAAEASVLAQADQLRTAILRAVSHDLRTPLASIKASVSSLLQADVQWSDADRGEFLTTIDEETDRLDNLVGNLLDMSRIEIGAVDVLLRPVGLEEVVGRALASISDPTDRVEVEVSERLPRVMADPALLERAVANLVGNALSFSPPTTVVRIEAGQIGARVDLRIIDRGRGVAPAWREQMFEPFQRLGDSGTSGAATTGVGLGLAVAKGFVEVMDGRLILDDTPGGGLTASIELPQAPTQIQHEMIGSIGSTGPTNAEHPA